MRSRPAPLLAIGIPALLLVIAGAFGQQRAPDIFQGRASQPNVPVNNTDKMIVQSFPPNGVMETAWKIEWDTELRHGLVIKNAWFKRSPTHDWMEVLGDTRVSELFVP